MFNSHRAIKNGGKISVFFITIITITFYRKNRNIVCKKIESDEGIRQLFGWLPVHLSKFSLGSLFSQISSLFLFMTVSERSKLSQADSATYTLTHTHTHSHTRTPVPLAFCWATTPCGDADCSATLNFSHRKVLNRCYYGRVYITRANKNIEILPRLRL